MELIGTWNFLCSWAGLALLVIVYKLEMNSFEKYEDSKRVYNGILPVPFCADPLNRYGILVIQYRYRYSILDKFGNRFGNVFFTVAHP